MHRGSLHRLWTVGRSAALALTTLAALAPPPARGEEPPPRAKRLIEFGWDEPDTAFLRQHLREMEATPFDGCVYHVSYRRPDGSTGNFTWECWGKKAFGEADLQEALADLKASRWQRFTHNFLRFNTTPADLDWFDDFAAVLGNARLGAGLAREGRSAGVLFDIEQYNGQLFNYEKQRDAGTKPWKEYAEQTRHRGREVMEAFQEGFPDLTVFLTFGYSLPWSESMGGTRPLAQCSYGLLAPFLDGMVEAARGSARIVDGYELSYGHTKAEQLLQARRTVKEALLPIVVDPSAYARVGSLAFGIWLDHDWRGRGWHTEDFAKNLRTPEAMTTILRAALEASDEYVWIYSETPRWWSPEGGPQKLPGAYAEAVRRARPALDNPFFAMATGTADAKHATATTQAALLAELGYAGTDHLGLNGLTEKLEAVDRAGLQLFNVYLGLTIDAEPRQEPGLEAALAILRGRDTMLWVHLESQGLRPAAPEGKPKAVEALRELADLAAAVGLRVALYPHTGSWLERVDDALALAASVDRKNLGVTFNLCHWLRVEGGGDPRPLLERALPRLFAVTINGADVGGKDWKALIQTLDRGSFDIRSLLATLENIGYRGPIGLQGYGIGGSVRENLGRSMDAWRRLGAQVAAAR